MAEVPAAATAQHLGARHAQRVVFTRDHGVAQRLVEARPAGAAVELGGRREQIQCTTRATEHTGAVLVIERAAVRLLGAGVAQDLILLRAQELPSFGIGVGNSEGAVRCVR